MYRSTDLGETWTRLDNSQGLSFAAITVDYNGTVYAILSDKSVSRSTNHGVSWTKTNYSAPFLISTAWNAATNYKMVLDVTRKNLLVVADRGGSSGVLISSDQGRTWTRSLSGSWIVDVACSPSDPDLIVALGQDGKIWRSSNSGESFSQTGEVRHSYWQYDTWPPHTGGIAINGIGTVIAIGRYEMGISTNGGLTFTIKGLSAVNLSVSSYWPFSDRGVDDDQFFKCCDLIASADNTTWISADGAAVKRSTNNGQSWVSGISNGIHGLWAYGNPYYDSADPNRVHISNVDFGHAYTTDLGVTWISSEDKRISCQGVCQDPNNANIYYKITMRNEGTSFGIYKSTGRGEKGTWTQTASPADWVDPYLGEIAVDPTNSDVVYFVVRGCEGVFKSTDGGNTFTNVYAKNKLMNLLVTKNGNVYSNPWAGPGGLHRYVKATDTWGIARSGSVQGFAVNQDNENILWASSGGMDHTWGDPDPGHLYKSTDGGATWEDRGGYDPFALYIDPVQPNVMLMSTADHVDGQGKFTGVMRSLDGGETWSSVHGNSPYYFIFGFQYGGVPGRVFSYNANTALISDIYTEAYSPTVVPVIKAAPDNLFFSADQGGGNPAAQNVTITNSGLGGTLGDIVSSICYTSGGPAGWLSINRSGSGNNQSMANSVINGSTAAGIAGAAIYLTAPGAPRHGVYSVTFKVNDLTAPVVQLLAPNGGELWANGSVKKIKWTASDNIEVASRSIYYSTDGGTWTFIDSAAGNSGEFEWTPTTNADLCWISVRAYDAAGNSGADQSNNFFTIASMPYFSSSNSVQAGWGKDFSYVARIGGDPSGVTILNTFKPAWLQVLVDSVWGAAPTLTQVDSMQFVLSKDSYSDTLTVYIYTDNPLRIAFAPFPEASGHPRLSTRMVSPSTMEFVFFIPEAGDYLVRVYDCIGRKLWENSGNSKRAQTVRLRKEFSGLGGVPKANGVYFVSLECCNRRLVNKFSMLR
jgi:hypothetical protein